MSNTIIELSIRRLSDTGLTAELRAYQRGMTVLAPAQTVTIDTTTLLGLSTLHKAYGAALAEMIFTDQIKAAWERARGQAEGEGHGIHLRVLIDDSTGALHALCWELLQDPVKNMPLAQQESGSLARTIVSDSLYDPDPPARPALSALVAIAGPSDTEHWGLTPVDVAGEARRALDSLGEIKVNLLAGDQPRSTGPATLANIRNSLRVGKHILYLIGHGKTTEKGSVFYLVDDDGKTAPISGDTFAAEIAALDTAHRPLLAVLVACESADQDTAPLTSIGPLLAQAGIPAVVAMQAKVTMNAAARFTKQLLIELAREGRIDQALAAARKEMGSEWWVPVLWLRSRDGRLWSEEPKTPGATALPGGITVGGNVGTFQQINITGGQVGSIIGSQTTYGSPPASVDQSETLRRRLADHRATLSHYLDQLAIAGSANVRPEVMHGIREARGEIRRIKTQLRARGQTIEDGPDDEG